MSIRSISNRSNFRTNTRRARDGLQSFSSAKQIPTYNGEMSDAALIHDLGTGAEDSFRALCSAAAVTRNKPDQDFNGGNYLIEFPAKVISGLPHDLQTGEHSARVQVKSEVKPAPGAAYRDALNDLLKSAITPAGAGAWPFMNEISREMMRLGRADDINDVGEDTLSLKRSPT